MLYKPSFYDVSIEVNNLKDFNSDELNYKHFETDYYDQENEEIESIIYIELKI